MLPLFSGLRHLRWARDYLYSRNARFSDGEACSITRGKHTSIMSPSPGLLLRSVSVVVIAQSHNPSILTPDFLRSEEIVPSEWEVAEAVSLPPVSFVRFQNGIQWVLDDSRLNVTENCSSSFQDLYEIHQSVSKYLSRLPHVPYRDLGLNWSVSIELANPDKWLTRQFLKPGPWDQDILHPIRMIPKFILTYDDVVLNVAFSGQVTPPRSSTAEVVVQCNVHHDGPHNAAELREAIGKWNIHQKTIIDAMNILLRN